MKVEPELADAINQVSISCSDPLMKIRLQYLTHAGLQLSASAFQAECEKRKIKLHHLEATANSANESEAGELKVP